MCTMSNGLSKIIARHSRVRSTTPSSCPNFQKIVFTFLSFVRGPRASKFSSLPSVGKALRTMKRILFTCLQVAITVFLLWWIFRDPAKRTQMFEALQSCGLPLADSRSGEPGLCFPAADRTLAPLARRAKDQSGVVENLSRLSNRRLLQPVPSRRHGRRYREDLLCDAGDRFEKERGAAQCGGGSHGRHDWPGSDHGCSLFSSTGAPLVASANVARF